MTIRVYSFDFDGCLFNNFYIAQEIKDILTANEELLSSIKKEEGRKVLLIGSNRQSVQDDNANSRGKGSCYPAIQKIKQALGAEFDPFLMTDLYNDDLKPGDAYKAALELLDDREFGYDLQKVKARRSPDWMHDSGKLTLLYAQIQKIALDNRNANENIEFNFFDDKVEILDGLHAFFKLHPHMIPSNVILKLNHYEGPIDVDGKPRVPLVNPYEAIQGTGVVNKNFKTVVQQMVEETLTKTEVTANIPGIVGPLNSYSKVKQALFDTSAINTVEHYTPPPPLRKSRLRSLGNIFSFSTDTSPLLRATSTSTPRKNRSTSPEYTTTNYASTATSSTADLLTPIPEDDAAEEPWTPRSMFLRRKPKRNDGLKRTVSTPQERSTAVPKRAPSPPKFFDSLVEANIRLQSMGQGTKTRALTDDDGSMDSALSSRESI